jgi:hypothetical protein
LTVPNVSEESTASIFRVKLKAADYSEIFVTTYEATIYSNSQENNLKVKEDMWVVFEVSRS